MNYVELHCRSAFSFLRGASQPEHLVRQAAQLGLDRIAVCDRDGVYGAARVFGEAKEQGMRPIVGAELTMEDGLVVPVLVKSRAGYHNLCRLITEAKLRGTKTHAPVFWRELPEYAEGLLALTGDEEGILRDPRAEVVNSSMGRLKAAFGNDNVFVEIQRHAVRDDLWRNQALIDLAQSHGLRLVATNGVLHHEPEGRRVLDIFTCARNHTSLDKAGRMLALNAERHLKSAEQMAHLFSDLPEAITNTLRVAERVDFTLEDMGYKFPEYPVPVGESMESHLRYQAYEGAKKLYGGKLSQRVRDQLERELRLICELGFAGYFLIVWDIVNYCRDSDILMQGRGSAANSVVCYSLGITACDPIACNLLFERFLNEGQTNWPDIDLDLPSGDRREQVIQEIYRRYGKHGAAMTANVITYRGRSAMREIGKAMGFSEDMLGRFSSLYANGDFPHTLDLQEQMRQSGLAAEHPRTLAAAQTYCRMYGLPRHLGQHSGGMIICQNALSSIVPLENASMPGRVVAQWDKDDCEDLGIIKVDFLGLGMMAAVQDALEMCLRRGHPVDLAQLDKDDEETYALMQRADTIGTFQVESRAQMATLTRLKPKEFYDVVIQVAIIRPGPIQGKMVHPYLNRREGFEELTYFNCPELEDKLKPILKRTLGVPLFQEQLLKIAMELASFSGGEAEELRRALSFHRSHERMAKVVKKLKEGLARNHIAPAVAEQVMQSVQSFAVYGFPESHAISFALIAYASCWLKVHRTVEFYCSLLNNQPMGFYSSATLITDAKAHGVKVRPVSVLHSGSLCTIEEDGSLRLGLCMVRGLNRAAGDLIEAERRSRTFDSLQDFRMRIAPSKDALRTLARIGALNGLVEHRRDGLWQTARPAAGLGELALEHPSDAVPPLPAMNPLERMQADFDGTGVTTGKHPMALIREELPDVFRANELATVPNGAAVTIAGMVICRQRPGTAKGFVFISLEDETGVSNAIVQPALFERQRLVITQEGFLKIHGMMQNARNTLLIKAQRIEGLRYEALAAPASHDFR